MFNELNKVFDRNFVLGFFLPALLLLGLTVWLLGTVGLRPSWLTIDPQDPLKNTTVFALVSWVLAVFLQAINTPVYRLLEGYWPWGLERRLNFIQVRRFRRLNRRLEQLQAESLRAAERGKKYRRQGENNRAQRRTATAFPAREELVLPTSFGNVLRSFEDYPRDLYGFESIPGWHRLLAVVPKDYRELLDGSRANTDFWVNLWCVGVVLAAEYVGLWSARRPHRAGLPGPWFPAACLAFAWVCYRQACAAALTWGEWVKAAFDAYLPELGKKLGYKVPVSAEEARRFWRNVSAVMVFRRKDILDDDLAAFRAAPAQRDGSGAAGAEGPARQDSAT